MITTVNEARETFDEVMEDADSGLEYDYISASNGFDDAKTEEMKLKYKQSMDIAAANLIKRVDHLECNLIYLQDVFADLLNKVLNNEDFDARKFSYCNGFIK